MKKNPTKLKAKKRTKKPVRYPFNLEAALCGVPVVTRDGRRVTRIVRLDRAIFKVGGYRQSSWNTWTLEGSYLCEPMDSSRCPEDIFLTQDPLKNEAYQQGRVALAVTKFREAYEILREIFPTEPS